MSTTPSGWYQDPYGRAQLRWWDGSAWTDTVMTEGRQFQDPPGAPVAAATGGATAPVTTPAVPVAVPPAATTPAPPMAVPPVAAVAPPAASRSGRTSTVWAAVAVGALVVGGVVGYVVRGGGKGKGNGTTASTSTLPGGSTLLATPILKGLASLNAYEWHASVTTTGPAAGDVSQTEATGSSDSASDSTHQKETTKTTSGTATTDPSSSESTTETWRVGNVVCTYDPSDQKYQTEVRNPFELDLSSTLPGVFDLVVATQNAQFVGNEDVAGVAAKHYTFTVEGLGTGSAAQVTSNEGELWVAVDGSYVLKYRVSAGLRTAPEGTAGAESFQLTALLELTSVNQPVPVTLPSGCPPHAG